jgi:hypothetical protein
MDEYTLMLRGGEGTAADFAPAVAVRVAVLFAVALFLAVLVSSQCTAGAFAYHCGKCRRGCRREKHEDLPRYIGDEAASTPKPRLLVAEDFENVKLRVPTPPPQMPLQSRGSSHDLRRAK